MFKEAKKDDFSKINLFLSNSRYKIEERTFMQNPYRHYLLFEEVDLIGIVIYDKIYDRFELIYIYVDEKKRKRGYGYHIMNYFLKIVEKNKGVNITLEVDVTNKNAISLYEKSGFKIICIRKNYYGKNDGYLMIRKM